MTVVYLDLVFVLNTIIDYMLLLTTASLAGTTLRRRRFAIFAVLGGLYAVGTFLLPILATPLVRLLFGGTLAYFTFYLDRRPWRIAALFLLLSGALAGMLLALGLAYGSPTGVLQRIYYADISWGILLGAALLFYILMHLVFRQSARYGGGDTVDIVLYVQGRCCRLRALRDSGNTLRDPIYGRPVLVAQKEALIDIWSVEIRNILEQACPIEDKMASLAEKGYHFTLIPYQCVGDSGGLLLAVRSDYLRIGKRIVPRALVALTDTEIGSGCHALWGGYERGGMESAAMDHSAGSTNPAIDHAG